MASYTYSNTTDFINASDIILSDFQTEIENSSISSANVLYLIEAGDNITIYFDGTLSGGDQTTLLGLVNAYTTGATFESVVTDTGAFDLSNKNLLTDTNYFVDPINLTKRIGFSSVGNTTGTTLSLASQTSVNRTITFPDITDTVVTLASTQTLTNKTLNNIKIAGTGSITANLSTAYIQPSSTAISGSNNYFFTYLGQPTTTGSTTGSAYTVYIDNAPSGTITTPYSLYINAGKTYIGGALQIPTGAQNGYLLRSDGVGNTSWISPSSLGSTFSDGTSSLPGIAYTNELGTGFYRPVSGQIGVSLNGASYILFKTTGTDFVNGSVVNIGTSGTTSPLNVFGLITGNNGLTISSGTTINASGLITGTNGLTITGANSSLTTLSTSGLISANGGITSSNGSIVNIGTSGTTSPLNVFGLITGNNGLTISSGTSALQAVTSTTINASGLITGTNGLTITGANSSLTTLSTSGLISANGGITSSNGNTVNIGTSGTTSPLNVFGLITGNNGLTISSGTSALQAVTSTTINASGLITANAGVNVTNGQILNVGTSGTTSSLNVYGQTDFLGVGSSVVSSATVYIAPSSTAVSGANNYHFTYLAQPTTSGTTTGSAYTIYIDNAPSGTITTPYALYVNAGKTYIGGTLQIPTGSSNGAVLTSDASGNSSWETPGVAYATATVSSTITTTSTTAVNIAGMTLTPPAGTYYFVFTGVGSVNNNSRGFNVQLANNGTLVSGSLMTILTTTAQSIVTTSFVITVNGSQNITAQWFISNGAGTLTLFTQRSLTALKLSP
jgi:hypothetical protein